MKKLLIIVIIFCFVVALLPIQMNVDLDYNRIKRVTERVSDASDMFVDDLNSFNVLGVVITTAFEGNLIEFKVADSENYTTWVTDGGYYYMELQVIDQSVYGPVLPETMYIVTSLTNDVYVSYDEYYNECINIYRPHKLFIGAMNDINDGKFTIIDIIAWMFVLVGLLYMGLYVAGVILFDTVYLVYELIIAIFGLIGLAPTYLPK